MTATRYRITTKVVALEQKQETLGHYPTGKRDPMGKMIYAPEYRELGWFVTFEGSRESLGLGFDKPALRVGQRVDIVLEPAD